MTISAGGARREKVDAGAAAQRARVVEAAVRFIEQPFVKPLIISSGAIEVITQADAVVMVDVNGQIEEGHSCIYLSDLWAWPEPAYTHEQRDAAMRAYCQQLAQLLPSDFGTAAHPLITGLHLHEHAIHVEPIGSQSATPPTLARCVCASIFDAAVHDAVGRALGVSAFDLYEVGFAVPGADPFFGGIGGTVAAIRALLQNEPRTTSPAWWLVGKADDLERDLRPAIERHGYFGFKLKTMGQDARIDASRVTEVYRAARRWGIGKPRLSVDSNEANPDAQSVLDFLEVLRAIDAQAYEALEIIEQPTGRDIERHAFDWAEVAKRKPVMVDEGLLTLKSMQIAREQHWSGFALKTCKGHSYALTAAAWAHRHGMQLSLQDLTNPGASMVHAALFAAHVPTQNGVELNSPQFTPNANDAWRNVYPNLFQVHDGLHQLPPIHTIGLGGM